MGTGFVARTVDDNMISHLSVVSTGDDQRQVGVEGRPVHTAVVPFEGVPVIRLGRKRGREEGL
jgi:hypothetical protein